MTILVVEDNIISARIVENVLRNHGFDCISARNGLEAIKQLQEIPGIHLVITDVLMPEMDGLELLKEMMKTVEWRGIPKIICTTVSEIGTVKRAAVYGCRHYLVKPVDARKLIQKVDEAMKEEKEVLIDKSRMAMRLEMQAEEVEKLYSDFFPALETGIKELSEILAKQDDDIPVFETEKLAESAGLIGAERLAAYLEDLALAAGDHAGMSRKDKYKILLREMKMLSGSTPVYADKEPKASEPVEEEPVAEEKEDNDGPDVEEESAVEEKKDSDAPDDSENSGAES